MGLSGEALAVMAEEGMTRDSSISASADGDVRQADGADGTDGADGETQADGAMLADGVVTSGNVVSGNKVFSAEEEALVVAATLEAEASEEKNDVDEAAFDDVEACDFEACEVVA